MKIDSTGISPAGNMVLTVRLGVKELIVIEGLIEKALKYTPLTKDTVKIHQSMQAMKRCLKSAGVVNWVEENRPVGVWSE